VDNDKSQQTTEYQPKIELNSAPVSNTPPNKGHKELYSTLAVIVLAPVIALLLTFFVFQSYEVDGPSMEPTLQDKDRLIVNKTGKTFSSITGGDYIPDRYEIIVFTHGGTSSSSMEKKQLIKRVIGLPGDRVVIQNGVVTVYNAERPGGFLVDNDNPARDGLDYTDGNIDQSVKEGEVFVLGDNRANSLDSRSFSVVKSKNIVGSLSVRIFPLNHIDRF
jgi:signal peptidase I